jgi:hypothetical protein
LPRELTQAGAQKDSGFFLQSRQSSGPLSIGVDFSTLLNKLFCFFFEAGLKRLFFGDFLFGSEFANVLGYFDELRLPANLALRVTLNVSYPAAPARSRVHRSASQL